MNNGRYSNNAPLLYHIIMSVYRGGWDTEGITVLINNMNNSTITCHSTFSARFAVLADLSGGHDEV